MTAQNLNDLYTALSADGLNRNGGKLSGKTLLEVHRLIHAVLEQAVREGVAVFNAGDRVEPPKQEKHDPAYFQPEEIKAILEASDAEPEQWRLLIRFLMSSGCRRGEALAMTWDRVDFDNKRVFIDRQVLYTKEKGVYVDTPKTASSIRFISLPADLLNDLRHHIGDALDLQKA